MSAFFPHAGDHELFTPDPTEPDGSCAHDYLCAYCNDALDGDVAKRIRAGINLSREEAELLVDAGRKGFFEDRARGEAFKGVLVRLNTFLVETAE